MWDKLQNARSDLDPEVQEDAGREELLLLGVARGGDILQVDSPQLGEDERVEQRAPSDYFGFTFKAIYDGCYSHVYYTGLTLLCKPSQDNL